MAKCGFNPQTVVRNKRTGDKGVVVPDMPGMMNCNDDNEVGVVYEGTTASVGTDYRDLEVIGPEGAVADMKKCGAGKGEETCMWMVIAGAAGAKCERFGNERWSFYFRTMTAKRDPVEPFPNCQFQA